MQMKQQKLALFTIALDEEYEGAICAVGVMV